MPESYSQKNYSRKTTRKDNYENYRKFFTGDDLLDDQ
jgi:hypothetical protein